MNSALPDTAPLTPQFLNSLSQFLKDQHGELGEGDISGKVKAAIEQRQSQDSAAGNAPREPEQGGPTG